MRLAVENGRRPQNGKSSLEWDVFHVRKEFSELR